MHTIFNTAAQMTNEQINAAIARECGWTNVNATHRSGKAPSADYVGSEFIPDYCADLNAMHEAEKVLATINRPVKGCSEQGAYLSWLGYCGENNTSEVYECITATARQRAEAFLRTLGKWEESK
jgi:molybdopterin synthase catalytic subunit